MPEVISEYIESNDSEFVKFNNARVKQKELIKTYLGDFSKYSGKIRSNEIVSVFESIPSQLSKENKKFVASKVISGTRFSKLRSSIDWLVNAGLLIKVKVANTGELPFSAFTKENYFKLYFFDIGLLGALSELSPEVLYLNNDLFKTFKGAFCENFVAMEFTYHVEEQLYSWANNTSEIEFIKTIDGQVYPIEVKSGISGKLKSLNIFSNKYNPPYKTRISRMNMDINKSANFHNYPLYLAYRFPLSLS